VHKRQGVDELRRAFGTCNGPSHRRRSDQAVTEYWASQTTTSIGNPATPSAHAWGRRTANALHGIASATVLRWNDVMSNSEVDSVTAIGNDHIARIKAAEMMTMRFQTEMGLLQMIVKMNEALAKLLKSTGEAIRGLA
jgi:hypothetical protein